ncbi:MAG: phage portal protein [Ignavibacteriales bacterium]|nr:phage portal protein [Ignavibacteriales bacterium]
MAYITATEQMIQKVTLGRILAESKLIKGIVTRDRGSVEKKEMQEGINYYEGKHEVLNKDFRVYHIKGKELVNVNKANNRVVNAFHTDLVDQKKDYILSSSPTITFKGEETQKKFSELFNDKFLDFLEGSCLGASNQGIEWGHVYVNEKGEFEFTIIPATQIIPDYDDNYKTKVLSIMRYYYVDAQDEKGNLVQRTKIEIWNEKEVWFYIENEKGEFILDGKEPENPRPHWRENFVQGDKVENSEGKGWGRVPFFPLMNNDKKISDLKRIKTLIDLYDVIISNFGNDIEDRREMVIVIKNYSGQDNEELVQMLKESGVIKVSGDGGAESLELTIPVDAKNTLLKLIEKNIYRFGRGFNLSDENFAGEITGIALSYKYAGLDLKANAMIKNLKKYILELLGFFAEYNSIDFSPQEVQITFTKSMIVNETEIIGNVQSSTGIISKRTQLQRHPWVDYVDAELEQIEKETEGVVDLNDDGGELGKLPLAIQQLSLSMQRASDVGDNALANKIKLRIDEILKEIKQ